MGGTQKKWCWRFQSDTQFNVDIVTDDKVPISVNGILRKKINWPYSKKMEFLLVWILDVSAKTMQRQVPVLGGSQRDKFFTPE